MMYHVVGIRKNMSFNTKDGGEMSGLKLHLICPDDHERYGDRFLFYFL